jgi:hypothetical protein
MSDTTSIVLVAVIATAVIVSWSLMAKFDQRRIRENIEAHGGRVIEILRAWGLGGRNDRSYEVSYITARGGHVKATCKTSMWNGVYWVSNHPPEAPSDESKNMADLIGKEPGGPTEAIPCLGCGSMIPADQIRCPQCGWSYQNQ